MTGQLARRQTDETILGFFGVSLNVPAAYESVSVSVIHTNITDDSCLS